MAQAAAIVAERGHIVAAGDIAVQAPRKDLYEKEVTVTVPRAAGPGMYDESFEAGERPYPVAHVRWSATGNLCTFLRMVEDGSVRIDPLITHRLDFEEILSFYARLSAGNATDALGVVVGYPADASQRSRRTRDLRPSLAGVRDRRVGVGVLGSGLFTRTTLLPILSRLGGHAPRGLASRGGLHALVSARKYNFAYATTDHRKLLEDNQVDAVIITTRHDQHAALVIEALEAGKHVLVEKPLAMSREDLLDVLSAAEQRPDQLLMVGFNRRFAPTVSFLRENLAALTEPLSIQIRVNAGYIPRDSWVHGPTGGGRVHAEICHYI
ncbi:MAG: Gfo/Idh/MocA family oxidoreductase, partial [Myxococcota bacterium]